MFDGLDFFLFAEPNVRYVTAGTMLLGLTAGIVGNFTVLRRRALVGDAVAHAVLPGVVLGYMLAGGRNILWLTGGALVSGWLSLWLIDRIKSLSRIGSDTALGVVLSGFFGLGMMLLTGLQGSGKGDLSGLNTFLFGQAASLVPDDVIGFSILCVLTLFAIFLLFKELLVFSFDEVFAEGAGIPVQKLTFLTNTLLVIVIVAGLQTVGIVLMASMLILPAVASRQWSDDLRKMLMLSGVFGMLSGLGGSYASFVEGNIPTGPMMVLTASSILAISGLFAPKRGLLINQIQLWRSRFKARSENTLKSMYQLEELDGGIAKARSAKEIGKRSAAVSIIQLHLWRLRWFGLVETYAGSPRGWTLTDKGRLVARRMVRLHRLWELYLTERLNLAPDHVHDQAETMEHILTPELEERLIAQLNHPRTDPHKTPIPYEGAAS